MSHLRYPFFFIVDDGGFNFALPNNEKEITMEFYVNIVRLAKKYNIKIPVCFTMKYFDKENISGYGTPLKYIDDLIEFLKENNNFIEVGFHGLLHEHKNHIGEYYCLDTNTKVREEIQEEYIKKSKSIFEYWELDFPQLFVPPYHAWENGITDKILSKYGVKYLVSFRKLKFNNHFYEWKNSIYLNFLPRESLGIYGKDYYYNSNLNIKLKFFPQKSIENFVKSHIQPQNFFNRFRLRKTLKENIVHSYMLHIGNFDCSFNELWQKTLDYVLENEDLYLCKSNEDAVYYFHKINNEKFY